MSVDPSFAILLTIGYLPGMKVDVIPVIQGNGVNIYIHVLNIIKLFCWFHNDFLYRASTLAIFFFLLSSMNLPLGSHSFSLSHIEQKLQFK